MTQIRMAKFVESSETQHTEHRPGMHLKHRAKCTFIAVTHLESRGSHISNNHSWLDQRGSDGHRGSSSSPGPSP